VAQRPLSAWCPGPCATASPITNLKPADRCRRSTYPKPDGKSQLRPALLGLPLEHQPRGGPAGASPAEGPGHSGGGQPRAL
jgi:hypothetical protein